MIEKKWTLKELGLQTKLFVYGPAKGTIFLTPKSFFIWTKIQKYLDQKFAKLGVKNVNFPSLIPLELFHKEKKHIDGFAPEFFYVTSKDKQDLKYILRPTSEVIFAYYFHDQVKSYRDLPILLNQWVNVFRVEKNVNPFLRNCEFLWNEGHTIHQTKEEALQFCQKIFKIYQSLFKNLLKIHVFKGFKSEQEKFAGAEKTWTLETILKDGQFLQLSTVHFLDTNFTKGFDIKYLNQKNQQKFPFQTSWGLSTRTIAALILSHYDQKGLSLPNVLYDFHIAIVPLLKKDQKQNTEILKYCQKIKLTFEKKRLFKSKIYDQNKKNLGNLWSKLEINGIPMCLQIGKRELENKAITYFLRQNQKKTTMKLTTFFEEYRALLKINDQILFNNGKERQKNKIFKITNFKEYCNAKKNCAFEVYFCNTKKCETEIKNITQTNSRCLWKTKRTSKCFHCQKNTQFKAYFGRSY